MTDIGTVATPAQQTRISASKRAKLIFLQIARALGAFRLSRHWRANKVLILCYHGVWIADTPYSGGSMFIRPETFERRMRALQDGGAVVLPLSQALEALAGKRHLPPNAVVITIDDGWTSTATAMMPVLKRLNFPATLYFHTGQPQDGRPVLNMLATFCRELGCGDQVPADADALYARAMDQTLDEAARQPAFQAFCQRMAIDPAIYCTNSNLAYMSKPQGRDVLAAGIDIQLHTHSHSLHDFSWDHVRNEIEQNRIALKERFQLSPEHLVHFCYPSGIHAHEAVQNLKQLGIKSATTCETGLATSNTDPLLLPRIIDGDHLDDLEFEAELAGFMEVLRHIRRAISR